MTKLQQQCKERKRQREDTKKLQSLAAEFTRRCVDRALSELPASASFEITRQVIREATE